MEDVEKCSIEAWRDGKMLFSVETEGPDNDEDVDQLTKTVYDRVLQHVSGGPVTLYHVATVTVRREFGTVAVAENGDA